MAFYNGIEIVRQFSLGTCKVRVAQVEPLGQPGKLDEALRLLSPERRDKTLRYRFERGKWLSAGAGLLLDSMLSEHGLRERDMQLVIGNHGKPMLATHPELHFNLSHSGTLVACAMGDRPVGVDVQTIVEARRSLINYIMSPEEIAALDATTTDLERRHLFTQLWTLKESYAKATGNGLSHEFPSFSIDSTGTIKPLKPLTPPAAFKTVTLGSSIVTVAVLNR